MCSCRVLLTHYCSVCTSYAHFVAFVLIKKWILRPRPLPCKLQYELNKTLSLLSLSFVDIGTGIAMGKTLTTTKRKSCKLWA